MSEECVTLTVTLEFEIDPRRQATTINGILSDVAWSVASNQGRVVSAARERPDGSTDPVSMVGLGPRPGWDDPHEVER